MSVKELPNQIRPREKLLNKGANFLADEELLAIILRTGTKGIGVLQLAENLLKHFGGLSGLLYADVKEIQKIKGLGGSAKPAELLAVMELAKRTLAHQLKNTNILDNPQTLKKYIKAQFGKKENEVFAVIFLNSQYELIIMEELFTGTINQAQIYPREIAKKALLHNAAAIVLAHNHPSGNVTPSIDDIKITNKIKAAMNILDITLLDHLIVGEGKIWSIEKCGLI